MMSKFTDIELEYLKTQRLGRLATINKNGEPQITLVTYLYNAELDTIDIGGLHNSESQKFRNVARNGLASFVIDDVLPPFQPRGIDKPRPPYFTGWLGYQIREGFMRYLAAAIQWPGIFVWLGKQPRRA